MYYRTVTFKLLECQLETLIKRILSSLQMTVRKNSQLRCEKRFATKAQRHEAEKSKAFSFVPSGLCG